jgi:hypothetical protein
LKQLVGKSNSVPMGITPTRWLYLQLACDNGGKDKGYSDMLVTRGMVSVGALVRRGIARDDAQDMVSRAAGFLKQAAKEAAEALGEDPDWPEDAPGLLSLAEAAKPKPTGPEQLVMVGQLMGDLSRLQSKVCGTAVTGAPVGKDDVGDELAGVMRSLRHLAGSCGVDLDM